MLGLHHSSIAKLYFGAYLSKSFLGRRIKKKILNGKNENKDNLNSCLFNRYLATDPKNFIDVIIYLGRDLEDKEGGKTLLKNFIEQKEIRQSIINGIKKEEDIGKAGRGLSITAKIDDEFASYVVASIGIDGLSTKMVGQDASANGAFLESILISGEAGKESGMKLLTQVISKIGEEEDIEKIAWCVFHISSASKEVALKLVESININVLSSKINKEEDIEKVGWCVLDIARSSEEVGLKLINKIDIGALASKIDKEQDIRMVRVCILGIMNASKQVAMKLVHSIDIDYLASKIDKEDDIDKIEHCIVSISFVSRKLGMKLLEISSLSRLNPILKEELQKRLHSLIYGERAC